MAPHINPSGHGHVLQSPVHGTHVAAAPFTSHLAPTGQGQVLQSPVQGRHANAPPFASHLKPIGQGQVVQSPTQAKGNQNKCMTKIKAWIHLNVSIS